MAQPFDILVRRGAARSDRVTALLDRLEESGAGPVQLRVMIQARLPRGNARPVKLEYQRVWSTMVDCRIPEAAQHARRAIRAAVQALHRISLSEVDGHVNVDLRSVPGDLLLDELDRRGLATIDFESVPDAILRREFGRRLRGNASRSTGDWRNRPNVSAPSRVLNVQQWRPLPFGALYLNPILAIVAAETRRHE